MSYGFSMPMSFGNEMQQNQQPMYDTYGTPYPDVAVNQNQAVIPADNSYTYSGNYGYKKPSSVPAALGGFAVGGATAGILKARKNPNMSKKGEFSDTFVKNTYEAIMDKTDDEAKKAYKQRKNLIEKLDKAANKDELKVLLNDNKEVAEKYIQDIKTGTDVDTYVDSIEKNLKKTKKELKNTLEAEEKHNLSTIKSKIISCWDSTKKKFVKPDGFDENEFNIIKKMSKKGKGKGVMKAILIWGAITGAVAGIVHKILVTPKQQ